MRFLRTVSTRTLLAMIAGIVVIIGGGTAIAVAASSGGPVPRHESLARAIHGALGAQQVQGISARVTFTNHLIDASNIQGPSDPILQGASGRLWYSPGTGQLRIELQSDSGDGQVLINKRSFWIYDPASQTTYEGSLPVDHHTRRAHVKREALPSVARIQSYLNKLVRHVSVSGAIPSDVAGQPTYTVQVSPKHAAGLFGDAQLAWDAARGVPLRFAVYARGDSSPVIELKATDISYGSVPSSDFAISPPSGTKVVKISTPSSSKHHLRAHAVRRLPFTLVAPSTLAGMPRRSVTHLDWGGTPAAAVAYGQNLGGVVVLEQSARSAGKLGGASGDHGSGLSLPTVSIGGVSGQELDTALGTVVRFTRGDVTYTVLGSVSPAAAEAAARAL